MGRTKVDFGNMPECDVVVKYVAARYKQGLYSLILTTGLPGTGKSSCDLRLAELISLKLHGKNIIDSSSVIDSLVGLLDFLMASKDHGRIAIIEELSVLFPSRRSMAKDNVAIARILDTCRKQRVILLTNAPLLNAVDSHIRSLANILIETRRVDRQKGLVISKAFKLQTNPRTSKTYLHRFKRKGREVHRVVTRMPRDKMWEEYELIKDRFIHDLHVRLKAEATKKNEKLDKELGLVPQKEAVNPLTAKELDCYQKVVVEGIKVGEYAKQAGVSGSAVSHMLARISKKTKLIIKPMEKTIIKQNKNVEELKMMHMAMKEAEKEVYSQQNSLPDLRVAVLGGNKLNIDGSKPMMYAGGGGEDDDG